MILLPRYGRPGSDFMPTTAFTSATVRSEHGSTDDACAVSRGATTPEKSAREAMILTPRISTSTGWPGSGTGGSDYLAQRGRPSRAAATCGASAGRKSSVVARGVFELFPDPRQALCNVLAPVVPRVRAGVFVVLVGHVQGCQSGVEGAILIDPPILGPDIEVQCRHQLRVSVAQPLHAREGIARAPGSGVFA